MSSFDVYPIYPMPSPLSPTMMMMMTNPLVVTPPVINVPSVYHH
jgi:hypothetical protein